ncbi:MAG: POTRA domain-containing protein [Candidatus Bipolaricaulis sp.]|nr:POTRA domain-containing protein [Candidatus Bipolaricaulis sp.]
MEKRFLGVLFSCLALVGAACAAAEFPLEVTALGVEGNHEVETNKILRVATFDVGDVVTEEDIREASQAIYDLGWFTEVLPRVGDDGSITFRVAETPVIEGFEVTGNTYRKPYSLFGVKLFDAPIVTASVVRNILRENGVRKGQVLHLPSLKTALEKVVEKYKDRGYLLISIADVKPESILKIQIVEMRVVGNIVQGLRTVPQDIAIAMVDLPLDQPLKQSELQRVMAALRKTVYFSQIDVKPLQGPETDSVVLEWTVTERPIVDSPVAFTTVAVDGVSEFPVDMAAQTLGPMPEGEADNYAVLQMLEPLFNLYYDAGFIMVTFDVDRIEGDTLYLRVHEGLITAIDIAEGTETQGRVLRRNLALHVNRVLTYNDLKVSYQKLNSLGYFDSVVIDPVWADDGVHVRVSVTDTKNRGGFNGSLAVDPSSGALTGEVSVSQKNVLGTGQDISVGYKRQLSDEGDPEETTWNLGYGTVAWSSGFDRVSANVYRTQTEITDDQDAATKYLTIGGNVAFSYPVADYCDLNLSYTYERVRVVTATDWTPVGILGIALSEDSSDDVYSPNRGTRRSVQLQKAGGFAAGPEFAKLDISWVRFVPVYATLFSDIDCTFATRCKLGWGTENLSSTYAYDFGGATSVRGFTDESEQVDRMFVTNFEYRLELADGFIATAFLDWGVDFDRLRADKTLSSTGFELGVLAAGVFVRLDVIWVFGDDAGWVPRFDFAFGSMF